MAQMFNNDEVSGDSAEFSEPTAPSKLIIVKLVGTVGDKYVKK